MTAGKNPKSFKKKGQKKRAIHAFAKKEWYKILAPGFDKRIVTLTPCNKSAGLFNSTTSLKGRVFNLSLADCNNNKGRENENPYSHRKIKFQVEEVKGFDCYTNFYGIDITRDHACKMVKKWHSLIEGFVQAKTSDGFVVRMFAIAFTKKTPNQIKATCYLKSSHQKMIRKKMIEVMTATVQKNQLRDLVKILVKEEIGNEIQKQCHKIFPLSNCMIRKVKVIKKPKFDLTKLMELYKDRPMDDKPMVVGGEVEVDTTDEPKNALAAATEE